MWQVWTKVSPDAPFRFNGVTESSYSLAVRYWSAICRDHGTAAFKLVKV